MDQIVRGILVLLFFSSLGAVLFISDHYEKKGQEKEKAASLVVRSTEGIILHGCAIRKTNYAADLVLENTNEHAVRVRLTRPGFRGSENTAGFFLIGSKEKKTVVNIVSSVGFYIYTMDGVNVAWLQAGCPCL